MKKQKNRPKLFKIIALFLVLLLAFSCTACGGKRKEEAKVVCENFFQAYTSGDSQSLAESMKELVVADSFTDMQREMAKKLEFKTEKVKSKGDTMLVSAIITSVDLKKVLESLPETIDSTETAREALTTALSAVDVPVKEFKVDVSLLQEDGNWVVQMTPDLADALLGGYYSILEEATKEVAP